MVLLFYFILCSPLLAVTFDRVVAKVNEDVITLGNLKNSVASFLQRNGNSNSLSQSLENKKVMKQVLEELVAQKLQVHEAKKNGMVVTEETIESVSGRGGEPRCILALREPLGETFASSD